MYNFTYKEFKLQQANSEKEVEQRLTESGGRNEW